MRIPADKKPVPVRNFCHESSLIRDVLDNLEMEHALTWLLEAIYHHQRKDWTGMHMYRTTLFTVYVNFDNNHVRLSAELACHESDVDLSLADFLEILGREAEYEPNPLHYVARSPKSKIHHHRNPYLKPAFYKERELDAGFYA